MEFTFEGQSSVSWRWRTFRATKHQVNDRKSWKNSRTHPRRPSPNNPCARRHRWERLWSLAGDLTGKFEHVPHCREVCSRPLTNDLKQRGLNVCLRLREKANEDPTSISRIALFHNWKWNRRDNVLKRPDLHRELQGVLDRMTNNGFHGAV
jgi:hypothetical protein